MMSGEFNPINTREERESGSIGIGAMIVFIALILVAAVASTIIIKTAEELQQNAENTSDDTRKQISGKVSLVDVFVKTAASPLAGSPSVGSGNTDVASMEVVARVSSGSIGVEDGDIEFFISCRVTLTHSGLNPADGDLTDALTLSQIVDPSTTYAVLDSGTADTRAIGDVEDIPDSNLQVGGTYVIVTIADTGWNDIDENGDTNGGTKNLAAYSVGDEITVDAGWNGAAGLANVGGGETAGTADDDSYFDGDELTAGTVFKFEIDLGLTDTHDVDDNVDAGNGVYKSANEITHHDFALGRSPGCDAEAGTGQSLEIRLVVDGGGETLATLEIDSLVLGSSLM